MENDSLDLEPLITPEEKSELASNYYYQGLGIRELLGVRRLRIEHTSAQANRCGMFALAISTYKQIGITLTPNIFRHIFCYNQEMRSFNQARGYRNLNNFYDDQLARVLDIWGRACGYDTLQLGVFVEGSKPIIFGAGDKCVPLFSKEDLENERDFRTIWIHNNNAAELYQAAISHYSGVTVLELDEEQVRREVAPRKEKPRNDKLRKEIVRKKKAQRRRQEMTRKRDEERNARGRLGKPKHSVTTAQ